MDYPAPEEPWSSVVRGLFSHRGRSGPLQQARHRYVPPNTFLSPSTRARRTTETTTKALWAIDYECNKQTLTARETGFCSSR